MKIVLMGNPNVGKSAIFSRLTGTYIVTSNYPGSTVEYTKGYLKLGQEQAEVIDAPGTYTLDATNKAEEVAVELLQDSDIVINVVDATNLERNLNLTIQLLEKQVPMVIALNMWDDARHRGVSIDVDRLEEVLGIPVVTTVGVTGQGIKDLVGRISEAGISQHAQSSSDERWGAIGAIVGQVQSLTPRHHTWTDTLEDVIDHPVSGGLFAVVVLFIAFWVIRFIGEGLINYVTDPLFNLLWTPVLTKLSFILGPGSFWHGVLVGKLINGEIDYLQSFGFLSSGFYIPLAAVLPYIISFYLVLGLLEDVGYLPRLAILMDTLLHKLGLHGYAIIPTILGMGCNVPAIMATRILESRRERLIAATLISIAVPCASMQAMIVGLVGKEGIQYVAIVYLTLFIVWVIVGYIMNKLLRGFSPELLIEMPPYRIPLLTIVGKKLWLRVFGFLKEALPVVLGAILVINIFYTIGIFDFIADITAPVISGVLGLPKESVVALIIGFLRKDVAMGMLAPLSLTPGQFVISSTVMAMSFPCVATFVILLRELGIGDTLKATGIMLLSALIVGSLLNLIF